MIPIISVVRDDARLMVVSMPVWWGVQVTLLNQRLPWLRYEECKADYRQLQDQQKAMVRELEHKQRQLTQQQLPLRFAPLPSVGPYSNCF